MGCAVLAGCKSGAAPTPSADENKREEQQEKEEPKKKKKSDKDKKDKRSLAQRMAGKYSYDAEDDDPENDKYLIMNVITFGDNVYAFCGEAMKDEGETKEAYSYWAAEFVPHDPDDMKSTNADSVRVTELCFSNMSNAGKYWSKGWDGDITVKDDALLFEGFDKNGFLCDEDGNERLFTKDDTVEDIFPYINKKGEADENIRGLWMSEGRPPHVFLSVDGSNITVFKKPFDAEVKFAEFGCEFEDGAFTGSGNILGYGDMPCEISADYSIADDRLTMDIGGDNIMDEFYGKTVFLRAGEEDIPVIGVDDLELSDGTYGIYEENGETVSSFESGEYYGVFVASFKTAEECVDTEMKLDDAGYVLCPVVYTPDFSNLNPEPYYVVTAGLYGSKEDAEETLSDVKAAGFKDAYIKNTGKYIGDRSWYWLYGGEQIEVSEDKVILHNLSVTIPYMVDDEPAKMNLTVDKDTVFDSSAEMQFFGNYEKGESPYEWIVKNYRSMSEDPDKYMESGPALTGIFEVGLDGDRVTRYYGSYWWD